MVPGAHTAFCVPRVVLQELALYGRKIAICSYLIDISTYGETESAERMRLWRSMKGLSKVWPPRCASDPLWGVRSAKVLTCGNPVSTLGRYASRIKNVLIGGPGLIPSCSNTVFQMRSARVLVHAREHLKHPESIKTGPKVT